ncbi:MULTISPECIES: hypothetical protein [unclassified Thalassolituus]|uniref:hypothetical protein n=1 Tax=Oceanospirillaceae TaxID=135620 RepID=UPI000C4734AF|nr:MULTISPECIES: hypothetical protein [unclassified Thalassolituus]MCA6059324.1 hypothetical protein [Thalassolituus sp. ST750PaO-4]PIQ41176.1 MAG: hypothetical protein COW58_02575 [Thalassolituus sp. CG17_big_fil_post_rev_8_21_14_2_50_53_8]TVV43021.1 hypothetical protein FOT50_11270 [Thalassolituus sp. C2-1]
MELKKNYLALAVISAALVGCGGDDDNNSSKKNVSGVSCVDNVCTLEGQITEDVTLTADKEWRLNGFVTIGAGNVELADAAAVAAAKAAGVTLTIKPGVHVKAFNTGALLVTRGSKIMAEGTAAAPITFSSIQDDDFDGQGEWGGVVVQGFAPQYGKGNTEACFGTGTVCNVDGEGGDGIGKFGGNDTADNSGVIKYVRIAEAGRVAGPNNEINGLTLQGVGSGTTLEYIQIHNNLDDGIEWFGGNANLKHAVLTGNDDDDIDFDEGYQGNMQYVLIVKDQSKDKPSGSNDPRGVEANSSGSDAVSHTTAALANFTVVGGPLTNNASYTVPVKQSDGTYKDEAIGYQPGLKLRGQVNVEFVNTVVANWDKNCAEADDVVANFTQVESDCTAANVLKTKNSPTVTGTIASDLTISFDSKLAYSSNSTVNSIKPTAVGAGNDSFFEATDYIGAVDPDAATAWWSGWTLPNTVPSLNN